MYFSTFTNNRSFSLLLLVLLAIKFLSVVSVDNNVIFEKLVCYEPAVDTMTVTKCEMRPIAPNVYRMNFSVRLHKPVNNIWTHAKIYQRYSVYQKIADQQEDYCGFFRNETRAPILQMLFDNYITLTHIRAVKMNFECPSTTNSFEISLNKFNMSHFVLPLLLAARYKVDFNVTRGRNGRSIGFGQIFFRMSDFRLWH